MAKWAKGESGNPKGRPVKSRALTEILERAGSKTNQGISRKRLLADLIWQLVTTARAEFPDGITLEASPRDWLEAVKFLYSHIDGPVKGQLEVSGPNAGPISVKQDFDYDEFAKLFRGIVAAYGPEPGDDSGDGASESMDSTHTDS